MFLSTCRPFKFILISLSVFALLTVLAEAKMDNKKGKSGGILTVENQTYDIAGWSWAVELPNSGGAGSGLVNVLPDYGDIEIFLRSNELSALLLEKLVTGALISDVSLQTGAVMLQLQNVAVTGLSLNNPGKETVKLNYEEFTYSGNGFSLCYNLQSNILCN